MHSTTNLTFATSASANAPAPGGLLGAIRAGAATERKRARRVGSAAEPNRARRGAGAAKGRTGAAGSRVASLTRGGGELP